MNSHKMDMKKALQSVPEEALLAFIPFVPIDNSVALKALDGLSATLPALSESASSVNHHITTLTALLKANFLIFLKNVIDNKSFHKFVESYVAYRQKPYFEIDEENQSSVQLFRLDKLVFTVFFRVTCPGDEHQKIVQFVPKAPVTVFNASPHIDHSRTTNGVDSLTADYIVFFDQIKIMKIPYLMDIISIIGESNHHLAHKLLAGVLRWNEKFSSEFVRNLEETHRATQELVQNVWQTWGRLTSSSEKSTTTLKKGSRVINKSALANKVSPSDYLREILFLVGFAADIVYSLVRMVASLDKIYLIERSSLFKSLCLSKETGMILLRIIQMIYEIAVPTVIKVIHKGRNLASESTELLQQVDRIQDFLEVCQYWCIKGLMEFVEVAYHYQNHQHSHKRDNVRLEKQTMNEEVAGTKSPAQTWIDVLSHRLDVDKILVGAIYDHSDLQIGGLASDFLRLIDRSKLILLLKTTLSKDDIGNIEYFISSLCLEESSTGNKHFMAESNRGKKSGTEAVLNSMPSSTKDKESTSTDSRKQKEPVMQESISMIQAIFPDLGEGFIEACLGFYRNNTEDVIEALLSDNLHPQLSGIDRSLKKMWVGKQSLVRDNTSLLFTTQTNTSKAHEDKINYKAFMNNNQQENKRFQEVQKAMIKNIEKSQEYDSYIIDKEYDDDYDDQYDDSWASKKPTTIEDNAEEIPMKEIKSSKPPVVDWRQQMAETRRYNSLLREEEKEIQFWKDMENTNRKGSETGSRDQWKKHLEDPEGGEGDSNVNTEKKAIPDQQSLKKGQGTQPQSKRKEAQQTGNNDRADDKESEKNKQAQRRQYERKDRHNDAYRNDRRQRKERQGGFIPGSGL